MSEGFSGGFHDVAVVHTEIHSVSEARGTIIDPLNLSDAGNVVSVSFDSNQYVVRTDGSRSQTRPLAARVRKVPVKVPFLLVITPSSATTPALSRRG
jgi:hypothetical protein